MDDGMSQTPPPAGPRRMSPGLRVVFFLSLATNLLIVSLVAGFLLRGGPQGAPPRHVRDVVAPYTAGLSREDRREIGRKLYRDLRQEGSRGELRERARAEYREALDLLRADPFDAAAFAEVLNRQSARAAQRQQRGEDALVEHLAGKSLEERTAYADRVAEVLERKDNKDKKRN